MWVESTGIAQLRLWVEYHGRSCRSNKAPQSGRSKRLARPSSVQTPRSHDAAGPEHRFSTNSHSGILETEYGSGCGRQGSDYLSTPQQQNLQQSQSANDGNIPMLVLQRAEGTQDAAAGESERLSASTASQWTAAGGCAGAKVVGLEVDQEVLLAGAAGSDDLPGRSLTQPACSELGGSPAGSLNFKGSVREPGTPPRSGHKPAQVSSPKAHPDDFMASHRSGSPRLRNLRQSRRHLRRSVASSVRSTPAEYNRTNGPRWRRSTICPSPFPGGAALNPVARQSFKLCPPSWPEHPDPIGNSVNYSSCRGWEMSAHSRLPRFSVAQPAVDAPSATPGFAAVATAEQQAKEDDSRRRISRRKQLSGVLLAICLFNFWMVPMRLGSFIDATVAVIVLELTLDIFLWLTTGALLALRSLQDGDAQLSSRKFLLLAVAGLPLQALAAALGVATEPEWRVNRLLLTAFMPHCTSVLFMWLQVRRPLVARVAEFIVTGFGWLHVVSCGLHAVLRAERQAALRWYRSDGLWDMDWVQRYFIILDGTLRQLTGYNSNWPLSDTQTAYSTFVVVPGLCLYSVLIAAGTSVVSANETTSGRLPAKLDAAKDVMAHMRLPRDFQDEVVGYYRSMWRSCKSFSSDMHEQFVRDLPEALATRIMLEFNTQVVSKIPLFEKLADNRRFLMNIVGALQLVVAMPGELIVRRGDLGEEMFFLFRGRIAVLDEQGMMIAYLYDGACFGEMSLLFGQARSASVQAVEFCQLYVLTKEDFDVIMHQFPEALQEMTVFAEQRRQNQARRVSSRMAPTVQRLDGTDNEDGNVIAKTLSGGLAPGSVHCAHDLSSEISAVFSPCPSSPPGHVALDNVPDSVLAGLLDGYESPRPAANDGDATSCGIGGFYDDFADCRPHQFALVGGSPGGGKPLEQLPGALRADVLSPRTVQESAAEQPLQPASDTNWSEWSAVPQLRMLPPNPRGQVCEALNPRRRLSSVSRDTSTAAGSELSACRTASTQSAAARPRRARRPRSRIQSGSGQAGPAMAPLPPTGIIGHAAAIPDSPPQRDSSPPCSSAGSGGSAHEIDIQLEQLAALQHPPPHD
eukprot:TRINITY_DN26142_c0_g1_i4.p1 TRINITY_DN26142_c0_g1~~TRINITY_DN26142_c0_g1_i4.p1  ORF type:complete len:1150 (+),score=238.46 TRINITY_DN26142_c0_g1_i4:203-3451(+)